MGACCAVPSRSLVSVSASEDVQVELTEPEGSVATLELKPDKHGAELQLSARQQRLIQLQHPGAAQVVVKKLHGGFSGSLVLQTVAYDAAGRPDEPAVTKLDAAAALADEVEKQDSVKGSLGPYAIRVLRRPLYLGASGVATAEYAASDYATDADGAVVLELAGACWVLPEFFGKVADEQDVIVPFKQHLLEALTRGVDGQNSEGVIEDLYAVGGPLQRLACTTSVGEAATAKGGFLATLLEDMCREVARSMVPAQDSGLVQDELAYVVPASLLEASTGAGPLTPSRKVTNQKAFARSFVHECGEQVWGDAACAPLIALTKELRALLRNNDSWLASWRPLQLLQHGDLNAANVLLDARGEIWLIDFAFTGMHEAFCDAAKLIAVLLFEYLPCNGEDALRQGCAVVDALIPADGTRQLWEAPSPMNEQQSTPAHALALSLAVKVQHAACEMVMAAGRADGQDGMAPGDLHLAALWLPLLREALRCLRYQDLSVWQKRTAWHAAQRLCTALLAALQREPVPPPEKRADVAALHLAHGQLLLLRQRGPEAEAARLEGGSPADCHEVKPDGLRRLLLAERPTAGSGTEMALEELLHEVGDGLPSTGDAKAIMLCAAERVTTREVRAVRGLEEAFERTLKEHRVQTRKMSKEDRQRFEEEARLRVMQEQMEAVMREDEMWAATELRKTGFVELRRYAPGQQLSVLDGDCWRDMAVLSHEIGLQHRLRISDCPADASDERSLILHALNHAPLEVRAADFEVQRAKYAHRMSIAHANIRDALSGRPLNALEQCVPIDIASGQQSRADAAALAAISDVGALCRWLHEAHARRQSGERGASPAALLTAPPAAGKTCLVSQLVMHTLRWTPSESLVPLAIKVMDLQRVLSLSEHAALFASKWNWADAFYCATLGEASPTYRFLRQALLARRALLLLDGMDEGGMGKEQIERHVKEVLLPQGHPMLLTSRPDSLVPEVYEGCAQLQLCPLTADQQRAVIAGRLGCSVPELVDYVRSLPPDTDGNLLSGNPLMLNMLISIYESRQAGVGGMPSKLPEVYEIASNVMLGRLDLKERGDSEISGAMQLRWLLREVALEAHLKEQRQIKAETLQRAAVRLSGSGQRVYDAVAKQLALDRMPMLSVIEREPLVVRFTHLSFQEYFAARAICAIQNKRKGLQEPWRWSPWWGNAVRLGVDCGESFGLGLLCAAGIEGKKTLDLSGKLNKDSLAAIEAVAELIKASSITDINLEHNGLDFEAGKVIAAALPRTKLSRLCVDGHPLLLEELKSVASIDLSSRRLGVASAIIIAACVKDNTALRALNLAGNQLCGISWKGEGTSYTAEGIISLCEGLNGSAITSLNVDGHPLPIDELKSTASIDLSSKRLEAASGIIIARCIKDNPVLKTLNLSNNKLGPEGGAAIAHGLGNTRLKELNIDHNNLGVEGGKAISAVLRDASITTLGLEKNQLGVEGGKAIAAVLKHTLLTNLSLHGNDLGAEGGEAIATVLMDTQITNLNLDDTQLCGIDGSDPGRGTYTASGIFKLCEALKVSAVTSLSLTFNELGVEGSKVIAAALPSTKITNLNLSNNFLYPEGGAAIAQGIKGSSLKELKVQNNHLDDDAKRALQAVAGSGVEISF